MPLTSIILLILAGGVGGFAGGLLGLGGAFIMTPVQYFVYAEMGLPADMAIKTAFGTSLLVVLPIAVSGAWRHHRREAVRWRAAIVVGGSALVFAYIGATLATYLSGTLLKTAFGIIILISAIRMFTARKPEQQTEAVSRTWVWVAWAVPLGLISGLLGIGGGILMVPVLVLGLRFEMHYAVGTSLAVMILTSLGGVIGYIINGVGVADRLPYSLGYVNVPSWLLLVVPSVVMAQVGAVTAYKIPRRPLTYIFIVVLFYMGLRMVGVFEWLGWTV